MSAVRILGLGPYPIQTPLHGGQRRVAAFKKYYGRKGLSYTYASIYNTAHYKDFDVGPDDFPLDESKAEPWLMNLVGDVFAGQQGATDSKTFQHFEDLVERIAPDAVQLEQPFLWPLVKRLRETAVGRKPLLIYSSHNVEAPLKRAILSSCGIAATMRNKICSEIEEMEAEIAREADLVICVSEADRNHYCHALGLSSSVVVVSNGVDRPQNGIADSIPDALSHFDGRPYLMTVGSAHIPNIDGLCHYIIEGGIFFIPPVASLAICGGIAGAIHNHPEYRRYLQANTMRVRFYADISDLELAAIKRNCHGAFLPIRGGGGTNLKTAEALALGRWVVATRTALRGFETFLEADGVVIADSRSDFRQAVRRVLQRPSLELNAASRAARDALYWDRCFDDSGFAHILDHALLGAPNENARQNQFAIS